MAAEIAKAKSRLQYAELQLNRTAYLARSDTASQLALDQAKNDEASAQADVAEAEAAIDDILGGRFGASGSRVVVEEFLEGEIASLLALCDRLMIVEGGHAAWSVAEPAGPQRAAS